MSAGSRTTAMDMLWAIVNAVAQIDDADRSDRQSLNDLGLDSLGIMEVIFRCEDQLGLSLMTADMPELQTVDDIATLIDRSSNLPANVDETRSAR